MRGYARLYFFNPVYIDEINVMREVVICPVFLYAANEPRR